MYLELGCRDWKTGESLNYGFIGFDTEESCEQVCWPVANKASAHAASRGTGSHVLACGCGCPALRGWPLLIAPPACGLQEHLRSDVLHQAYFKMNNVLIDDRRIKVDFSQVGRVLGQARQVCRCLCKPSHASQLACCVAAPRAQVAQWIAFNVGPTAPAAACSL